MVLRRDKPPKIMSTEKWQQISADSAPPGVYMPNMSDADAATWRAKLIGGRDRRVEIRITVIGPERAAPPRSWARSLVNHAQVLIIVEEDTVRMSANATMDFRNQVWDELVQAIAEARQALAAQS